MSCDRLRVSSYHDGLLSAAEARAFERHLLACADCRQTLVDYRLVGEAIRTLPLLAPPPALRRGVMTRLPPTTPRRPAWGALTAGLVGAAAVTIIALLAGRALSEVAPGPAPSSGALTRGAGEIGPPPTSSPLVVVAAPTSPSPVADAAPSASPTSPPTRTPPPTSPTARTIPIAPTASPVAASPTTTPTTSRVAGSPTTASPASPVAGSPTAVTPPPTRTPQAFFATAPAVSPTARGAAPTPPSASPTPAVVSADPASRNVVRAPLVTPTPGCPRPDGRIGQTYSVDPTLQAKLGCPTGPQATAAGHEVAFQHGLMLRRSDTRRIYALGPGSWSTFLDPEGGRNAAALQPGEPAPPFAQAYRDHPAVRDLLGRAIADPRSIELTFQPFERATVIVGERRGLFVLYHDGRWETVPER